LNIKKKEVLDNPPQQPKPQSTGATAAWINDSMVAKAKALHTYKASQPGDLSFKVGEELIIFNKDEDWWIGYLNGRTGIIPSNYVQITSLKEPDKGRKRMSTKVSAEDLAELERLRNQVLVFPASPTKPLFQKGQTEGEYKKYMIDRYKYEKWENSKLLFDRRVAEGNKLAASRIIKIYEGFASSL